MAKIAVDFLELGEDTFIFTLPYGVCDTAEEVAEKIVNVSNFSLDVGARIAVKFNNANAAETPLLNVNNTGAREIKYQNKAILKKFLTPNIVYEFIYNGIDWEIISGVGASTEDPPTIATNLKAGLIKSGGDITVDLDGNVTVKKITEEQVNQAWNEIFKEV